MPHAWGRKGLRTGFYHLRSGGRGGTSPRLKDIKIAHAREINKYGYIFAHKSLRATQMFLYNDLVYAVNHGSNLRDVFL